MAPSRVVALDIGGTQVKGGWIDRAEASAPPAGALASRTRTLQTDLSGGTAAFLDSVAAFARDLGYDGALGVGVPGVFDPRTGALERSANLPALDGLNLEEELRARLGKESILALDNDANAAALGESWLGAGKETSSLILFTLGTGVGGGIILDGALFRGGSGRGGELGHLVVRAKDSATPEEEGLRCGCGAYGCLERVASATAAKRRARAAGLPLDLAHLARRARAGSPAESALFRAVGRDLGAGILAATALLDIPLILIGGGFAGAYDVLLPGIEEALGERHYGGSPLRVQPAALGPAAGWIGAARLTYPAL